MSGEIGGETDRETEGDRVRERERVNRAIFFLSSLFLMVCEIGVLS